MLYRNFMIIQLVTIPIVGMIIDLIYKNKLIILLTTICELYFSIYLYVSYNNNNIELKERLINLIEWGVDGYNLPLILLTTFIIPLVLMIRDYNEDKSFQRKILLIEWLLIVVFLINDILSFYTLFEIILIPMFLIIIKYGSRFKKYEAAYKFMIYTIFGSLFFIIGILIINILFYSTNNSYIEFLLHTSYDYSILKSLLFSLFFLSFAIKIPIFPFHIWLPMAHTEAPASGSVILAAILLKLGIFGFVKYSIGILGWDINIYMSPIIITLGLISMIYSTFIIFKLIDIKKIIAYSSIVHMNYMMIGIYIYDILGLIGCYYSVISHGIISGALFMLIGVLYRRYHTRLILYYKGLASFLPLFTTLWFLFILSNSSLPLTSSFPGEILILFSSYKGSLFISLLILFTILLSTGYNFILVNRLLFGSYSIYLFKYKDISLNELLSLFPLLLFNILLGIFTKPIINMIILPFTI